MRPQGLPPPQLVEEALLAYAFGWAENMVQAAIKAVPWAKARGNASLQALTQAIPPLIESACRVTDSQRQVFTPMLAILRPSTNPNTLDCSDHDRSASHSQADQESCPTARGRGRPCRLRQNHPLEMLCKTMRGTYDPGRHHQRHLHQEDQRC